MAYQNSSLPFEKMLLKRISCLKCLSGSVSNIAKELNSRLKNFETMISKQNIQLFGWMLCMKRFEITDMTET